MILDLKFRAVVQTEEEISYTVRTLNSQIIVDESEPQPVASHSLCCNLKDLNRKHVSQTTNCYIRVPKISTEPAISHNTHPPTSWQKNNKLFS
jgi:hypothetical protein